MSKVVQTIAVVAAVVALAATGVGALAGAGIAFTSLSASGLALLSGIATVATVIGIGASLSSQVFAPKPGSTASLMRRISPGAPGTVGTAPRRSIDPINGSFWHEAWWKSGRFAVVETSGNCLTGTALDPTRPWIVIDTRVVVRPGDCVIFRVRRWWDYYPHILSGWFRKGGGLVKRFDGLDTTGETFRFQYSAPPTTIETPMTNVLWAYRVRAACATKREGKAALREIKTDENAYDAPLLPRMIGW